MVVLQYLRCVKQGVCRRRRPFSSIIQAQVSHGRAYIAQPSEFLQQEGQRLVAPDAKKKDIS